MASGGRAATDASRWKAVLKYIKQGRTTDQQPTCPHAPNVRDVDAASKSDALVQLTVVNLIRLAGRVPSFPAHANHSSAVGL